MEQINSRQEDISVQRRLRVIVRLRSLTRPTMTEERFDFYTKERSQTTNEAGAEAACGKNSQFSILNSQLKKFSIASVPKATHYLIFTLRNVLNSQFSILNSQLNNVLNSQLSKAMTATSVALALMMFAGCQKDEDGKSSGRDAFVGAGLEFSSEGSLLLQSYSDDTKQLLPFAKSLYSAMQESPELRELIKNESLKQFNKEYEVLYQFIKDARVENELSVRGLLLKYFKDGESLAAIEALHPALTIHIPMLPAGSFSAENWHTKEQIPAVAIHSPAGLNPVIVSEKGQYVKNSDEFVIKNGHVPGFPVLVLKDNGRVVVSQNASSRYPSLNNRNSDYVFDFIDDCFDGSIGNAESVEDRDTENTEISLRSVMLWSTNQIGSKIIDAYYIFGAYGGWQRDYIYYNLTPSITTGALSRNFQETVISFRFSDQQTPQQILSYINNSPASDPPFPWTSGQYNFRLEAQLAANKPGYPSLITKYFSAYPHELFDVTWVKSGNTYIPTFYGYNFRSLDLPVLNWNLEHYGEVMKYSIWKMSPSSTVTQTFTFTSAFSNNVKYNVKEGLEYGNTSTTTSGSTYTITYQISDVPLGDVLVNFAEPAIVSSVFMFGRTLYGLLDYTSGIYTIHLIPVKRY